MYEFVKYCNSARGRESRREPAAAQVVQERLLNPFPDVTIINSIEDLSKKNRNTLELTTQPGIENVEAALPVDGKTAINTYLAM